MPWWKCAVRGNFSFFNKTRATKQLHQLSVETFSRIVTMLTIFLARFLLRQLWGFFIYLVIICIWFILECLLLLNSQTVEVKSESLTDQGQPVYTACKIALISTHKQERKKVLYLCCSQHKFYSLTDCEGRSGSCRAVCLFSPQIKRTDEYTT